MSDKSHRPTQHGKFPRLETGIHDVCLGNGTQWKILVARLPDGNVAIGVTNKGVFCTFGPRGIFTPDYVKEQFKVMKGDAHNLTDFIAYQLWDVPPQPVFGSYCAQLCSDSQL